MKQVAVILAGCGAKDGSEIQEATLALYALSLNNIEYQAYALDAPQQETVNHITSETENQTRSQIEEAARIVRGAIKPLSELDVKSYDALLIPGGTGTAKNLFTFFFDALNFSVNELYKTKVREFHSLGKPIAAMCIAPLSLLSILEEFHPTITLGAESELSKAAAQKFNSTVEPCNRESVTIDQTNKLVTTPSYMYGDSTIANIGKGAQAMAKVLVELM